MTEEGELKKQLIPLMKTIDDKLGFENSKEDTCESIIGDFLDLAKKEFPRCIFPDDAGIKYFQTAKEELAIIQSWFLKWFGSTETEAPT